VRSPRGTRFRRWTTERLREYLVKDFVIDDERLKNPPVAGSGIPDCFDELLERIRDIRASERRMYLRVTEIFAEDQARRRKQVFLEDWEIKLDEFLRFNERGVLAKAEYDQFVARGRALLEAEGEQASFMLLEDTAKALPPRKKRARKKSDALE
jgi:hypothetical protein